MLTAEQIFENKQKYLELLSKLNVDLTDFSKYLDSIDYFNQPASPQYYRAYPGGLCQHALDLCYELGTLCNAYFPGRYSNEDIIKVALFKDLYRAEMYELYSRNTKNEAGQWIAVQSYKTKEVRQSFGDIGISSYMIAKKFFTFTDEQTEAILNGRSTDNYSIDLHIILRNFPLAALTKMADIATTYLGD